jgi:hypothetical protein
MAAREAGGIDLLLESWGEAGLALREAILDIAVRTPGGAESLLRAMESGRVPDRSIPAGRREALRNALPEVRRAAFDAIVAPRQPRIDAAVYAQYSEPLRARGAGDAKRGRDLFIEHCAPCHRFSGLGERVGPELDGAGRKSDAELLAAVLDPQSSALPGYTAYVVTTTAGEVHSGLITSETATAVTVRSAGGKEAAIARSDIARLEAAADSLMPANFAELLDPNAFGDLVAFLRAQ